MLALIISEMRGNTMKLHISNGNTKLGQIPNTSFPPVITCRKNAPCATDGCYALKFYKMYSTCKNAWDENLELYKTDPHSYWEQLYKVFQRTKYFRYFVSGDIPDAEYFTAMVNYARCCPGTEFLCFTKQYEIVNAHLANAPDGYTLPENLHVIFSGWDGLEPDNPYGLPQSEVIIPDMEVPEDWKICGGNCTECACRGVGCWELKQGETIAFYKH